MTPLAEEPSPLGEILIGQAGLAHERQTSHQRYLKLKEYLGYPLVKALLPEHMASKYAIFPPKLTAIQLGDLLLPVEHFYDASETHIQFLAAVTRGGSLYQIQFPNSEEMVMSAWSVPDHHGSSAYINKTTQGTELEAVALQRNPELDQVLYHSKKQAFVSSFAFDTPGNASTNTIYYWEIDALPNIATLDQIMRFNYDLTHFAEMIYFTFPPADTYFQVD